MLKKILNIFQKICIAFSVMVFCYIIFILAFVTYFNSPNSYHNKDVKFTIEKGVTFRQFVTKLHEEKIIKNKNAFLYLSQLMKGRNLKVRYGEYFFEKNISYYKILNKTVHGYISFRKITIAEVEILVPAGELDPDQIHTPGIYVHRIFQGNNYEKRIEQKTVRTK